ncbi:hypothetical protein LXL04_033268 [Taraxacum kok-saghyz]
MQKLKKNRFFGNFFQRIVMIKNVLEGSEVGFLKGITLDRLLPVTAYMALTWHQLGPTWRLRGLEGGRIIHTRLEKEKMKVLKICGSQTLFLPFLSSEFHGSPNDPTLVVPLEDLLPPLPPTKLSALLPLPPPKSFAAVDFTPLLMPILEDEDDRACAGQITAYRKQSFNKYQIKRERNNLALPSVAVIEPLEKAVLMNKLDSAAASTRIP